MERDPVTNEIIGAAIEVHRELGPGLLESAYEKCLCYELSIRKIPYQCQVPIPVQYKDVKLDAGYIADIIVGDVIVELNAIEKLLPIHKAQLLTYLRLTKIHTGLLINFNVPALKDGIIRRVL